MVIKKHFTPLIKLLTCVVLLCFVILQGVTSSSTGTGNSSMKNNDTRKDDIQKAPTKELTPQEVQAHIDFKVGLYSGTFDPATKAHNSIIRSALENLKLNKLYIFVNKNGEKNYKCSSSQRVDMLKRMLEDLGDRVVIVAQRSDSKIADYKMIKSILNEKIVHITGEDSYLRRLLILPEKRMDFDAIAIIPRTEMLKSKVDKPELESIAFYLPMDKSILSVSSTRIRQKLAENDFKNIDLTPEVLSYIIENRLYNNKGKKDDRRNLYTEKFYSYVGKILAPCNPPEFDPLASEEAWEENFYKTIYIENKGIINVAK